MNIVLIALGCALLISGLMLVRQPNKTLPSKVAALGLTLAGIASFVPVYGTIGGIFTAVGTFFMLGLLIAAALGKGQLGKETAAKRAMENSPMEKSETS